jgi:ParB family chromosome partitioning protein
VKKTKRLGRGLNALIPDKSLSENNNTFDDSNLFEVEVANVRANPYQPRQEFDPVALDELKTSIKEKGIIQPITIRKVDSHYELIAGERRLRAVVELGFKKVPAYLIKVESKEEMLELAIIENVQRERLNPIEQAQAFQRLVDECKLTQDEVAQKIGKDRTTITNFLRLLKLPRDIQDSVRKHEITMGHARTLLAIDDIEIQRQVWKKVIKNGLSVRRLEKIIKDLAEAAKQKKDIKPRRSVFLQKAEENLRELLGTKVNIRSRKEGGTIEVEFYSPEDLNRLLEIFQEMQKV